MCDKLASIFTMRTCTCVWGHVNKLLPHALFAKLFRTTKLWNDRWRNVDVHSMLHFFYWLTQAGVFLIIKLYILNIRRHLSTWRTICANFVTMKFHIQFETLIETLLIRTTKQSESGYGKEKSYGKRSNIKLRLIHGWGSYLAFIYRI